LNVDPDPATPILSIIFSSVADPDPGSLCDPCTRIWDPQQWFFWQFWNCLCSLCRWFLILWSRLLALGRRKPTLFPQLLLDRSVLLCWCLFSHFYYCNSTFSVVDTHRFNADMDPNFYWVRTRIEHKYG
jgi:hypothetical protein